LESQAAAPEGWQSRTSSIYTIQTIRNAGKAARLRYLHTPEIFRPWTVFVQGCLRQFTSKFDSVKTRSAEKVFHNRVIFFA
jgi:hypothetical protein